MSHKQRYQKIVSTH